MIHLVAGFLFMLNLLGPGSGFASLNRNRPILDAHNCYPYEGKWADRIDRALKATSPVGIEQDLAWYVDPATGRGRAVVSHSANPTGAEPTLREHFFERVRPIVEQALKENDRDRWPVIVLHFDFKDNREPLLRAVWDLLGEYENWITTAPKMANRNILAPLSVKPLLVLTEDQDEQETVFFKQVPVGAKLRLFGSAHTRWPEPASKEERARFAATAAPTELLAERPSNYRRWWNASWQAVIEGGAPAGEFAPVKRERLHAFVEHAHSLGFWIRFYALDGFTEAQSQGWDEGYNFGSLAAVEARWHAAIDEGVDLIATDQYEDLGAYMHAKSAAVQPR